MEKSQPFAVKLTDTGEKPAKKPKKTQKLAEKVTGASHQERMQAFSAATSVEKPTKAGKGQIAVEKSLEERTKEFFSSQSTGVTAKRLEIEGGKSIAERQAELQQSIKAQAETQHAVKVGSVKSKVEEIKAAIGAPKVSRSSVHQVEGQMSIQERMELLKKAVKSSTEDEKTKSEVVKTGQVAEIAAMLQQKKETNRQTVTENYGSVSEKRQAFQQALKGTSTKPKEVVLEGVPSVRDRMSMFLAKPKEEEAKESTANTGLVKGRISMFTSGKAWRKEEEEEDSEEEEEEEEEGEKVEEVQTQTRNARAQQSLIAKYADKTAPKAQPALESKRKLEEEEPIAVEVRVEEKRQDEGNAAEDREKPEADGEIPAANLQSDRTNKQEEPIIAEPIAEQLVENEENPLEEQAEEQGRLLLEAGEVQQEHVENLQENIEDEEFPAEKVVLPAAELVPEQVGEAAEVLEELAIEAKEQPVTVKQEQAEPAEPQAGLGIDPKVAGEDACVA